MKTIHNRAWQYIIALISLLGLTLLSTMTSAAAEESHALRIGQTFSLTSKHLKEKRSYSVYLPESCHIDGAQAPCPVLYLLDGERTFHYGSGVVETMRAIAQIPAMIMVAIHNTNDRTRDLTPTHSLDDGFGRQDPARSTSGGGDNFLNFIEYELTPEIDARYQPLSYRILVGRSFGGLITLHSLVTRPSLFQAHIAIDPSLYWDNNQWLRQAEQILRKSRTLKNRVYLSVAEHAPKGEMDLSNRFERPGESFAYALQANPSPYLKSTYQQFSGEDHGSVALPSLYAGLKFVFAGYKNLPPVVEAQGIEAVMAYYRDYWAAYGIQLSPPQAVIAQLAFIAESNSRYAEAIEYHQFNIERDPKSAYSHYALAKTYVLAGDKTRAVAHYKKALSLQPALAVFIKPWLIELKE